MSLFVGTLYSAGVGILGAVGAKGGEEISKKLGSLNPLKIVGRMIPEGVKKRVKEGPLSQSINWGYQKAAQLLKGFERSSITYAPVVEEAVFRAGIQGALVTLLTTLGVDPVQAQIGAIALTNTIFTLAHNRDIDTVAGTDTWLKSTAFGIAYSQGGLLAAVVAHMVNNVRQLYMPSFQKLFSDTSAAEDFAAVIARNRQLQS